MHKESIYIHGHYQSQFNLLGAMANELVDAFNAKGHDAQLINIATDEHPTSGIFLFFNSPSSIDQFPETLFTPGSSLRAIQYFVDHPLALPDNIIDDWYNRATLENFRMCLPCIDDIHILRPRFPGLIHTWIPHGIPRNSLCDLSTLTRQQHDARPYDVVVTGSIKPIEDIQGTLTNLTPDSIAMVNDIAYLMLQRPHMGYLPALDLVLGSRKGITGNWSTQKSIWSLVTMIVNRQRRIATVQSLQGLKVGVFGSDAWIPECTGTIEYAGEVQYAHCAQAFAQARVALAWGPTQFVHSYSERIMQAMAGGAAVIADDRILIARDFNGPNAIQHTGNDKGPSATLFDWANPTAARAAADQLLADPDTALALARRGRTLVENKCLWEHRVDELIACIGQSTMV